jgi:hypothetical protein
MNNEDHWKNLRVAERLCDDISSNRVLGDFAGWRRCCDGDFAEGTLSGHDRDWSWSDSSCCHYSRDDCRSSSWRSGCRGNAKWHMSF